MRNLVLGALVWLVALSLTAAAESKWALVVGVDDYTNEEVTDLRFAGTDAKLFAEILVETLDFPKDNVFVYTTDGPDAARPRLTNLVFRLDWLSQRVQSGDTLVVYFAGHGITSNGDSYLLTQESDGRSEATLMISSLRGEILFDYLKRCPASNVLVFLDACRNDPARARGDADNTLTEAMSRGLVFSGTPSAQNKKPRSLATIFACSEGERSYEWDAKGHGFFTYYLAEDLRKKAAKADGKVTLLSLMDFLANQVGASADRELDRPQTPMLRYEGPGPDKWVLASHQPMAVPETPTAVSAEDQEKMRRLEAELKAAREKLEAAQKDKGNDAAAAQGGKEMQAKLAAAEAELEAARRARAEKESAQSAEMKRLEAELQAAREAQQETAQIKSAELERRKERARVLGQFRLTEQRDFDVLLEVTRKEVVTDMGLKVSVPVRFHFSSPEQMEAAGAGPNSGAWLVYKAFKDKSKREYDMYLLQGKSPGWTYAKIAYTYALVYAMQSSVAEHPDLEESFAQWLEYRTRAQTVDYPKENFLMTLRNPAHQQLCGKLIELEESQGQDAVFSYVRAELKKKPEPVATP